jgi:hypothetical protein
MNVSVKAVRDRDGAVLGETVFDITDREGRSLAIAELLNAVYAKAPDPLNLEPFIFKFDVARNAA